MFLWELLLGKLALLDSFIFPGPAKVFLVFQTDTGQIHQFANYDEVIAGMILMIGVVIGIMAVFERVQNHFLCWRPAYGERKSTTSSL